MKKRILSLVLATVLICSMAIPASATQYNTWGYYNGTDYYEVVDNCTPDYFSGLTLCDGHMVHTNVHVDVEDGGYRWYYGTAAYGASSTTAYPPGAVASAKFYHYVDNMEVFNVNVKAAY